MNQILVEKNVPCTLRDGTVLYADIYRPNKEGKFPVLLTRHPYNKDSPFYSHRYLDTNRLVQNGYVVINQDVRGRYNSEGNFYPMIHEAEDGYDTVEWAAKLPFSNGKVGMFGLSYYGFTQLLAASEQPPHLQAIAPVMTLSNRRDTTFTESGAFLLASSETWGLESLAPDEIKRKYKKPALIAEKMKQLAQFYNNINEWYRFKPVKDWPPLKELGVASAFYDSFDETVREELGERMSISHKYHQFTVPAYHIAGWYDNLLPSTIQNYLGMSEKAATSEARDNQKLMIGAWGHGVYTSTLGERSFGLHAAGDWIDYKEDLTGLHLRWFDYWLKGIDTGIVNEAPIKIFVMGINEWRDEYEWPLARTNYKPFYLHSKGKANTRFGDGMLSWEKPGNESSDQFFYDPENPVPTKGGGTLFAGAHTYGPQDQRRIEEREDVLVYTSQPLEQPLELTGPIKAKLWVQTDAVSTDFTAKLIDVLPDGTAYNLTDGIVRLSNQTAGKTVEIEIDMWATSNVFLPGHCIRVEVSSSNFPRYDANLNTGRTMIDSLESKCAQQTIFHQEEYPSYLLLPVIEIEK